MNVVPARTLLHEKPVAAVLILGLLTGCLAKSRHVPASQLPTVQRVLVVPIEPPPLILPSAFLWSWSDSGEQAEVVGGSIYPPQGAVVLAIVAGILILVKRPKNVELRKKAQESLDAWLSSDSSWLPTRVLAEMVADELASNREWQAVVRPQPYRLPEIQRRETTWHMENWYRPLRAWYNDERPQLDLSELRDREFDAVIEIGLTNYEIVDNQLVMQVMVKWFDDAAGEPLGRARHHAIPTVGSPDEMFGNHGEGFKRLFGETGRELVRNCLTEVVGAR